MIELTLQIDWMSDAFLIFVWGLVATIVGYILLAYSREPSGIGYMSFLMGIGIAIGGILAALIPG